MFERDTDWLTDVFRTRSIAIAARSQPVSDKSVIQRRASSESRRRSPTSFTSMHPLHHLLRTTASNELRSGNLRESLFRVASTSRFNTNSDSEVLLNVLAHENCSALPMCNRSTGKARFSSRDRLTRTGKGALFAVVAQISGYGCSPFAIPQRHPSM